MFKWEMRDCSCTTGWVRLAPVPPSNAAALAGTLPSMPPFNFDEVDCWPGFLPTDGSCFLLACDLLLFTILRSLACLQREPWEKGRLSGRLSTSGSKLNNSSIENGHRKPHLQVPGVVMWRSNSSLLLSLLLSGLERQMTRSDYSTAETHSESH